MTRQVVIDIVGDSSKFTKSLDVAEGKSTKFGNVIKGVGMGIGMGVFGLVETGVSTLIGSLDDAAAAFKEDQVSVSKLGQALKNNVPNWNGNTAAIEKVITAQMNLGFADEEQRDSLAMLVGSTNDVQKAQELQVAAMDLARLKGISLADATGIMVKVNEGNFKALKSVGISLGENATSMDAYNAIMAVAGGQAEAYAATAEGKQLVAQNKVGESMEKIGAVVTEVSNVAMPILADAFTNIIDLLGQVWTNVQPVVTALIKELTPAFQTVVKIVQQVAHWIGERIPSVVAFAQKAFNALRPAINLVIEVVKTAIDIFMKIAQVVFPIVEKGIGTLGDIYMGLWTIIGNVAKWIRDAWNNLVTFFTGLPSRIGGAVKGMWDGIWNAFKSVINMIIRGWNSLKFTLPSINLGPLGNFGGFTIGTPDIPYLHQGGIVPGSSGEDVLAILQAGERVIPRDKASGATEVHIHIDQGAYIDGPSIDRLANLITQRLRFAPGT